MTDDALFYAAGLARKILGGDAALELQLAERTVEMARELRRGQPKSGTAPDDSPP